MSKETLEAYNKGYFDGRKTIIKEIQISIEELKLIIEELKLIMEDSDGN